MNDASMRTSSPSAPKLELWSVPFVPGSATSEKSAKEHVGHSEQDAAVLTILRQHSGATDAEIYARGLVLGLYGLGTLESSIRRSRITLTHRGLVVSAGVVNRGHGGRQVEAWKLYEVGQ